MSESEAAKTVMICMSILLQPYFIHVLQNGRNVYLKKIAVFWNVSLCSVIGTLLKNAQYTGMEIPVSS